MLLFFSVGIKFCRGSPQPQTNIKSLYKENSLYCFSAIIIFTNNMGCTSSIEPYTDDEISFVSIQHTNSFEEEHRDINKVREFAFLSNINFLSRRMMTGHSIHVIDDDDDDELNASSHIIRTSSVPQKL